MPINIGVLFCLLDLGTFAFSVLLKWTILSNWKVPCKAIVIRGCLSKIFVMFIDTYSFWDHSS